MLFDDDEQLEVRHVISLAHHDASIYSGGDPIPEGELYIKKNAIRLARKSDAGDTAPDSQVSKPFYLFSESCSAKEDFYFALLRNQEQALSADKEVPEPLHFDVQDIISLVHRLHSSEENVHTRWLNALIGRVFLAVYKTRDLENFIREKLTKKISRVKRPSFLSRIVIRDVHPGTSAPYIFNPRLKELNVEGECVVEADIRYTGNFRIEVATTARIDLGARFKVREVDLVLSVAVRKIEGHGLFKMKAPPSNRFWFAFQSMPKMEMSIEPIVSSRQITYTMIIRQIENRIKEVVAESIVLPFWDDTPFMDTQDKKWRGGIWTADNEQVAPPTPEVITAPAPSGEGTNRQPETLDLTDQKEIPPIEKSYTDPLAAHSPTVGLFGRKGPTKTLSDKGAKSSTTNLDTGSRGSWPASARSSPNVSVVQDSAKGEAVLGKKEPLPSAIATLSAMAGSPPKTGSPLISPMSPSLAGKGPLDALTESDNYLNEPAGDEAATSNDTLTPVLTDTIDRRHATSSTESVNSFASTNGNNTSLRSRTGSVSRGFFRQDTGASTSSVSTANSNGSGGLKNPTLTAVSNAAIQAKQWGLNALQRRREANEAAQKKNQPGGDRGHGVDTSQPMGRGRPLPPPGTPLPPPDRSSRPTKIAPKRKPLPPPLLPERATHLDSYEGGPGTPDGDAVSIGAGRREEEERNEEEVKKRRVPPPPLPKRRSAAEDEERVLVVEAPVDSEPGTPSRGSESTNIDAETSGNSPGVGEPTVPHATEGSDKSSEERKAAGPAKAREEDEDDGFAGWMDDGTFEEDAITMGAEDGPAGEDHAGEGGAEEVKH